MTATVSQQIETIAAELAAGRVAPYLGAGVLALGGPNCAVPASPEALAALLTAKTSVPHKIKSNLGAAAQFIENFKHRKTVVASMTEAFSVAAEPNQLHAFLAGTPNLPLLVHAWYDDLVQQALAPRSGWGLVQGLSQSEHFGQWTAYYRPDGSVVEAPEGAEPAEAAAWSTLVYEPFGAVTPAANFLVSDADFVEVLTEIDIQTPIPAEVQNRRRGRSFLFLGCRFWTQGERTFPQQIMKRSCDRHWAVLPEEPTRNELKFMERYNIERLDIPLAEFVDRLEAESAAAQPVAADA